MPLVCLKQRKGTAIDKDVFKPYVSFLLRCDSIPLVDVAGGRTMTISGTVTCPPGSGKFSTNGIKFSGSSFLSYPSINGFGLDGEITCTAEAWVLPDTAKQQSIMSTRQDGSTGWDLRIESSGAVTFYHTGGGSATLLTSTPNIYFGAWNHVALVKNNNLVTIFINGVDSGSKGISARMNPTGSIFRIGAFYDSGVRIPFSGFMDEIRITPGIARYTSNFAVPVGPFTY